jgi:hypothetical protein
MRFYLVSTNDFGWDEYTSFVVRASSPEQARELVEQGPGARQRSSWEVSPISARGQADIILGSFNAG